MNGLIDLKFVITIRYIDWFLNIGNLFITQNGFTAIMAMCLQMTMKLYIKSLKYKLISI